jgi:glycosyltransferase involved in cell wall biosynthesis
VDCPDVSGVVGGDRLKLLFVVNEDWFFVSHRLALAAAARDAGFEVAVATRLVKHRVSIEASGLRAIPFLMNRRGLNPLTLLREAMELAAIFRRERPDIVHLVALRPVIVGGIAARLAGIRRVVSAITGMGFLFYDGGRLPWVRSLMQKFLPRLLTRGITIVQNQDDARQLESFGLANERLRLIRGAGVDVDGFVPMETANSVPVVMMASRLLWDKGVGEFVEAARVLHGRNARFVLVGAIDGDNPAAISESDIRQWVEQGTVEWWGHSENMAVTLKQADIFCLPSFGEGLPKVVLEAMACGKACVTTDIQGCREAVRDGDNGILVPVRNAAALANAIERLLDNSDLRACMATRGRERAVNEFSQRQVIAATLAVYRELQS